MCTTPPARLSAVWWAEMILTLNRLAGWVSAAASFESACVPDVAATSLRILLRRPRRHRDRSRRHGPLPVSVGSSYSGQGPATGTLELPVRARRC